MRSTVFLLLMISVMGCQRKIESAIKATHYPSNAVFEKSKDKNLNAEVRLKYLDSALKLLPNSGIDSLTLAILYNKSFCHYLIDQPDSTQFYDQKVFKEALEIGNSYYAARASKNIGIGYYDQQVYDSAYFYHNLAKNFYLKLRDSVNTGKRLIQLALIQQKQNDFFGAKETLTEALTYFDFDKNKKSIASVYNTLGTCHKKLFNYSDALTYYTKAIETAVSPHNTIIFKNNLGTLYIDTKEFSAAIDLYADLLKNPTLVPTSTQYARILDNYAYAQWLNKKIDVEDSLSSALKIRKLKNDRLGQIASYTHLAEYFTPTDGSRAKKYFDTVIQISRQLKIPKAETDALQFLMHMEPTEIAFRDRYIFLKDSMYNNELSVKTQFAKMKYDDEQEKEKILKLETETAQKRAELAEQTTQKTIFLSLSSLLLLGGISFLYLIRQRHKKEKLQEVYKTETRISRDLHDGLANDIFGLMTEIQSQGKDSDKFLNRLEDMYQTTRKISHENSAIKTGKHFKDELGALIGNYQDSGINILVKGLSAIDWHLLDEHKCVIVHRSVKELLVNLKKHAQANLVSLQFEKQKNRLVITYIDNGIGFQQEKTKGVGLTNTENRIHSLGGHIIFGPKHGSGAKITISIPF